MKRRISNTSGLLFPIGIMLILLGSCTIHNVEEVFSGNCTPDKVSYSVHISPLMEEHCTRCHGGSSPVAGFKLETYSEVKLLVDAGYFPEIIQFKSGKASMPPTGKIDLCAISLIEAWVDAGAPE